MAKPKKKAQTKIIALVGMVGSGKSEAARFFSEEGFPVLRFGQITDEGIEKRKLPLGEKSERAVREDLRKELGMGAYAVLLEPKINEALKDTSVLILDGLYSWEEYIYLKNRFKGLLLLAVYCRPELRYQRVRNRKIRPLTPKTARERDTAQLLNLNKAGPIAIADYLIENSGSKSDLKQKVKEFLGEFIREDPR
ncbi:MAG: hypothetical protein A2Z11_02765 [Candidatus Woykebacteria bacterium RBG_16_43_9]|uniref:Dephospho-CoA kinase n=1 Tax=Candidatus Woykebacteria bacterium RBG_16_43_9 TaxID=1802596 RepID=A0A1G1WIE5_9BACT|nr:MAG: hypothetical protein A2Z11_02765 [Candidatus Woykebacteria bacterium RBG_16_43_9]